MVNEQFTLEELTKQGFEVLGSHPQKNTVFFKNDYLGKAYLLRIEGNYLVKQREYEIEVKYDKR
jgi:hypothetical protein